MNYQSLSVFKKIILFVVIFAHISVSNVYALENDILSKAKIEIINVEDDIVIRDRVQSYYTIDNSDKNKNYSIQNKSIIENTVLELLTTFDSLNIDVNRIYPYGLKMYIVPYHVDNVAAFVTYNDNSNMNVYFLKTSDFNSERSTILYTLHELGHTIDREYFTQEDRTEYIKIKDYKINTPWYGYDNTDWYDMPAESFAEDFNVIFNPNSASNRTNFGDMGIDSKKKIKELILKALKRKIEKR